MVEGGGKGMVAGQERNWNEGGGRMNSSNGIIFNTSAVNVML